uniref:Zinc finger protein 706 n=1 Tax=Panthera leo TaxID=9689 RepID=A0A8C8X9Z6_PANLE
RTRERRGAGDRGRRPLQFPSRRGRRRRQAPPPGAYVIGARCHWPARPERAQACEQRRGGGGGRSRKASGRRKAGGRWGDWESCAACAGTSVVASPEAEAAAGARGGGFEARAVVLSALLFPFLGGWRRPKRCWARSPLLSLRPPPPALSRCAVSPTQDCPGPDMARGQQKIQSQQKNAKKQAGQKKKQGHDQKAAAKAALIYTCTVCRTQMPDPKTFKQHFESKHPKTPLPPELADVQA